MADNPGRTCAPYVSRIVRVDRLFFGGCVSAVRMAGRTAISILDDFGQSIVHATGTAGLPSFHSSRARRVSFLGEDRDALGVTARKRGTDGSDGSSSLRRQISEHVVWQRLAPADFRGKLFIGEFGENARPHEGGEGAEPVGAGNVVFDTVADAEDVARVLNL